MDSSYSDVSSFWASSNFGQLPDDDFMAILQKQFPFPAPQRDPVQSFAAGGIVDGINPQNISRYSLSSLTPPSEDSSPSPPHDGSSHEPNSEDSSGGGGGNGGTSTPVKAAGTDSALKRKASDVDIQGDGPSQKSQHTLSNDKKGATTSTTGSRRKSLGNTVQKDESRLLKRKEQNRAAQRAFRERKEKHVKDLEDKVADLEAKNEAAQSENENLRDLLSRLQSENVMLKQTNFTFTMAPKPQGDSTAQVPRHFSPESSMFSTSPSSPSVLSPTSAHPTPKPTNPLDWTSLTSFDPNMLNLLDESPQTTATTSAMNLDIFGSADTGPASGLPFTTIASNPLFMSFASSFDNMYSSLDNQSALGSANGSRSSAQPFPFDISAMSSWPTPPPPTQDTSLDDLFAGYMNSSQNAEFSSPFAVTPSISPITHQTNINTTNFSNLNNGHHNSRLSGGSPGASLTSSISSPSSRSTASSDLPVNTPMEGLSTSGSPKSDPSLDTTHHDKSQCPKTKTELVQRIADAGASPFAPLGLQQSSDAKAGLMVTCAGTKFPKTEKNDKNLEVLSAWRSITSNPRLKDANIDINDLCTEFTSKARCDGTKVVLEPEEVDNIIESLANKKQ